METLTARRLLGAVLIAWFAIALGLALTGPPLGHDEAAFALSARGGGPLWLYRSPGVITVAELGLLAGGAEWALRAPFALLALVVPLGAYLVGRAAFSARVGAWAAAVLVTAHHLVLRSAELLGDVVATGCVLIGVAVLTRELGRDDAATTGPRWRLVAAAPAFAAAFYFRYGSGPVIALSAVVAAALWWRPMLRRPLPVLATAAALAVLLVPHVLHSLSATGTPLGVLELSAAMPRRAYVGEGLVTYLTSNPLAYYGALAAPVMLAGVVGLVRPPARWRPAVFVGVVGLGQLIVIGLSSHGQPRYVFIALSLLVVIGVDYLARSTLSALVRLRRFALPVVALGALGVAVAGVVRDRGITDARRPMRAAAAAIRTDAAGHHCVVYAFSVPQLLWYGGCAESLRPDFDTPPPWTDEPRIYVVSLPKFPARVDDLLARQPGRAEALPTADPRARVWRVRPR